MMNGLRSKQPSYAKKDGSVDFSLNKNLNDHSNSQAQRLQILSTFSEDNRKGSFQGSLNLLSNDDQIHQNKQIQTTKRISNIFKLKRVQQQQNQIEKVAEQLITLKQIIRNLKNSISSTLQQGSYQGNYQGNYQENYHGNPTQQQNHQLYQNAVQRLQSIQDKRITPQYKQWIIQYFFKIYHDLKQITTQFQNYEKAHQKKQNTNIDLSKSNFSIVGGKNRQYQSLIQYQVKCKLIECILRLCKGKGIFSSTQLQKYSSQIAQIGIHPLCKNLQKYKMTHLLQKIKSLKKSSPEQTFYQWKSIHDQLQIINIQQIQRFYKQKKNSNYLGGYQNNQNGILIIGGSGVGKTTLFLSMAGERIIKRKIKSRNLQFQNYQAADHDLANKFKTSPFSTGCTRQPAKLQAPKKFTFPEELCLIDTAGFQDTRSGQIDIMNTLYTYQTIQQMKKLRIIIVISEKIIGQRDQGLQKLAKQIGKYFRDYQQVRQSILFVLTKFENVKKLKISCDNILKTSNSHKDTNEYQFVKHLQQSIIYKQCIQFRPTDQTILFEASYHIDVSQMDMKLKKVYKGLLKRFPIHHQYQNDYINLQYSKQTKDKLMQKKCYLQNMIRKLYKQGNNNFRFYLEQLMFLENKINKIDYNKKKQGREVFDILAFIQEINIEVVTKFDQLLTTYFQHSQQTTLHQILQLKNTYQKLFVGNVDVMVENVQILQQDYHYIFQQISQSINNLKLQFEKLVDQHQKNITKNLKIKPKWCHDIKNKKWLCAVINFSKSYYEVEQSQSSILRNNQKSSKKQKSSNSQKLGMKTRTNNSFNKQYKSLIKQLKKNQQKFRQQFQQQLMSIQQQIITFLTKKPIKSTTSLDAGTNRFLTNTQHRISQIYQNFKNLVFHTQMIQIKHEPNKKNIKTKNDSNKSDADVFQNPSIRIQISIPSDQKVSRDNLSYIISILKQNLEKDFQQITQNIELMNVVNHSLNQNYHDISRNVFQQIQRYYNKIRIYSSNDKHIHQLMHSFFTKIMSKVKAIISQINIIVKDVTKKQDQSQNQNKNKIIHMNSPYLSNTHLLANNYSNEHNKLFNLQDINIVKLSQSLLYCYITKINQIQQFKELRKQMSYEVRCFNIKLKDYMSNLQKYLIKYDEKLSLLKKYVRKSQTSNVVLEIYQTIKKYVQDCIRIEHQIKLIHHYFRTQQDKQIKKFDQKFENLQYVKSINYRHSRFLESQKSSIRQAYQLSDALQVKDLPWQLIVDYVVMQQIYINKLRFQQSSQIQKLQQAYIQSYSSILPSQFLDMQINELQVISQIKTHILQKLLHFPYNSQTQYFGQIQSQLFPIKFQPQPIKHTIQMFLYLMRLREFFQDLNMLSNNTYENGGYQLKSGDNAEGITPVTYLDQTLEYLAGLVVMIAETADFKYFALKQAIHQLVLDENKKEQILSYLRVCDLICSFHKRLQKTQIVGLSLLQNSLQNFKKKSLFDQIREYVDKCESIFYRVSKNIDTIQLQHLQNISQVLDKPQSTLQFLSLLKSQCLFFLQGLQRSNHEEICCQTIISLRNLIKKMQDSENQIDFQWQQQMKQLQKSEKDPYNSLQKLIKLYQQHISKVSTQKTLQYRFVQSKKQQLAKEIKFFLNQPGDKKLQTGQALCEQLKNYLNFLKSMKFKMVVNLNGGQDIKHIQALEKLYEREAVKSNGHKSQTDMSPSEARQKLGQIDQIQSNYDQNQRMSQTQIQTSHFHVHTQQKPYQYPLRTVQPPSISYQPSLISNPRSQISHSQVSNLTPRPRNIEQSFNTIGDNWSNKPTSNQRRNQEMIKSNSNIQFNTNKSSKNFVETGNQVSNIVTRSEVQQIKRHTVNMGNAMKKSAIHTNHHTTIHQNDLKSEDAELPKSQVKFIRPTYTTNVNRYPHTRNSSGTNN